MKTNKNILIIDLEATCWNGKIPEGEKSEIIEIGIAILDTESGKIMDNKALLITPTESSISPFCTELTTITQELLNKESIPFDEACNFLRDNYSQYTWASYGAYDIRMMKAECEHHKIIYPLSENHINVKKYLQKLKD